MNTVKLVGLGAVCANGLNSEEVFASVLAGRTSVTENGLSSLSPTQWEVLNLATPSFLRGSHCTQIGYHALHAALQEAQWSEAELRDCGFIFASTTAQIDQWEKFLPLYLDQDSDRERIHNSVANQSLGTPALSLTRHFGVQGPLSLLTSSCSASLQALATAFIWIRSGRVARCLVGATEIHADLTRVGFGSLRLLSKNQCRPFDKNRAGINLGEAGAFLCLERGDLREAPQTWGYLRGVGFSTDAYHATSPHPEGLGSQRAMQMALHSAGVRPSEVPWIYSHGTGSPANDLAESKAIQQIFDGAPLVTSTKPSHGHTLGASGALESVLGVMAMKRQQVLPTASFQEADAQIPLKVFSRALEKPMDHFLKNSLGFGGINVAALFSREPR